MTTGFNPQYQQYPMQGQNTPGNIAQQYNTQPVPVYTPAAQAQPKASVGAVEINIMNPTVNGPQTPAVQQPMPQYACPMYSPYPNMSYPQGSVYSGPYNMQMANYPMNYNNQIQQTNPYLKNPNETDSQTQQKTDTKTEEKKDDKKADDKKKQKVILTDDYIKSLENYMNNTEPKVRLMATKELLERFKEDDKRKNDAALTALLNKALQDPSATVRFVALTTLDVGYAQGNNETVQILKNIQNQPDSQYGEDALLASQVLLKMSGKKVDIPSDTTKETK